MYTVHNNTIALTTTVLSVPLWKMEPLVRKSTLKFVEKMKQVADTDQSVNAVE